MKVKLKATVTYEWEEDTVNWPAESRNNPMSTPEEVLAHVRIELDKDGDYMMAVEQSEATEWNVEKVELVND